MRVIPAWELAPTNGLEHRLPCGAAREYESAEDDTGQFMAHNQRSAFVASGIVIEPVTVAILGAPAGA